MRAVKLAQGAAQMAPPRRKPDAAPAASPAQTEVWRTAV